MNRLTRRQIVGTGLLVAAAVTAAVVLSPEALLSGIASLSDRPLLFGAALAVLYLVRPLFAWPISPISALVGYVLGITYGIPVALVGALLTSIPPFVAARYLDTGTGLFGRLGRAGQRVVEVTGATRGVLAARVSPLPADPVSYGAGFSGVSVRAYLVGTFVGEIPWVALEVIAGASMRQLTGAGLEAGVHVLIGSLALALLVLAGPAYRHVRQESPG